MTTEQIHTKLISALTEYDRKQSTKRGYNPHALGHYMMAVDDVVSAVKGGREIRKAVCGVFNDRLLDVCLRALGLPKGTYEECNY